MKRYFLRQDEQNNVYVSNLLELQPDNSIEFYANNFIKPQFDKFPEPTTLIEGASQEEIDVYNKPFVPSQISRMKFEMQLYITTTIKDENNNILQFGKTFQDIIDYIDSLQMSNFYKNLLKMRLLSCVTLERENEDLNNLAPGMGITQLQLDEIFINGNLIE